MCGLLRWTLPHSSMRWQTLCGGTDSLHWGQVFKAGATRKSCDRRFPLADLDFRLFGTATTRSPDARQSETNSPKEEDYPNPRTVCKGILGSVALFDARRTGSTRLKLPGKCG